MKSIAVFTVAGMLLTAAFSSYNLVILHTEVTNLRQGIDAAMMMRSDPKYFVGEPRIECTFRAAYYRYPDFVYHNWNQQDRIIVHLINEVETTEFEQRLWHVRTLASGAASLVSIAAFVYFNLMVRFGLTPIPDW